MPGDIVVPGLSYFISCKCLWQNYSTIASFTVDWTVIVSYIHAFANMKDVKQAVKYFLNIISNEML